MTNPPTCLMSQDNVKQQLRSLFQASLRVLVDDPQIKPEIKRCEQGYGDYQCNNAMRLWPRLKAKAPTDFETSYSVGQALMNNLPESELIESCSVTGPGFVNIVLSREWIAKSIHKMLMDGIGSWAPKLSVKRAVVEFSSPNIAKEMHVGHLRSIMIGDTLARMLEFSNVEVLRRNHVRDWGTQFGMLIEFLFEKFPDLEDVNDQAIGDLEVFYKASKKRFDSDSSFKERAKKAVVSLQGGEEKYRKAWKQICDVSRKGYEQVYKRLGVVLEEKGESFYNRYIPMVLDMLNEKGLGARVIFIGGNNIPLIVTKRDGSFNYALNDLTALWYRLKKEKAEWVIYVTNISQGYHFDMIFSAAKRAGWLPAEEKYPKTDHVAFNFVCGEDGKRLRTRSAEVVRLIDLLDEAKACCKAEFVKRGKGTEWTNEELEQTAEAVGYGAVKYANLKKHRLTSYKFNFDQMLDDNGNTAVYLLHAYARICSLIKESGREIEELEKVRNLELIQDAELAPGLHLVRFAEVMEEACSRLLPHLLCKYLYGLSEAFSKFNDDCRVLGSAAEISRLLLCQATKIVMKQCFYLLGITPVDRLFR